MVKAGLSEIDAAGRLSVWKSGGLSIALALAGLAALPPQWVQSGPVLCPYRIFFGRECYGCGMTRALSCLLHGQAAQAIAFNRGSVVLLPLLLLWAGAAVYAVLSKTVAREEAGA